MSLLRSIDTVIDLFIEQHFRKIQAYFYRCRVCCFLEDCSVKLPGQKITYSFTSCLFADIVVYLSYSSNARVDKAGVFRPWRKGKGRIAVSQVNCVGTESSVAECDYSSDTSSCFHEDDVRVICSEGKKEVFVKFAFSPTPSPNCIFVLL